MMFDVISPSDLQSRRMLGRAEVAFRDRDGRTVLGHLHQCSPLRALFPDVADGEPPLAALVTTSGGIVGGDRLDLVLEVGEGARAQFVAQAAEKVYRSDGADSRIEVSLRAGAGAWLEYLPQETILFDGARLRRRTLVEAAEGATVLAGEMAVFGRTARGERFTHGLLRDAWEVHRAGRLVWADALRLDGDITAALSAPAGFDGAVACATIVLIAKDPGRHLESVRKLLASYCSSWPGWTRPSTSCVAEAEKTWVPGTSPGTTVEGPVRAAATVVNGLLLVRWLARDALALRRSFAVVWAELRSAEAGLPRALPRLWHV